MRADTVRYYVMREIEAVETYIFVPCKHYYIYIKSKFFLLNITIGKRKKIFMEDLWYAV